MGAGNLFSSVSEPGLWVWELLSHVGVSRIRPTSFMRLFLLRHADAVSHTPDEERPLSPHGFVQIERLIARLPLAELSELRSIEHSPLVRAVQTAACFRERAGLRAPLKECSHIRPDDSAAYTAESLCRGEQDRLLVGHNPHHECLASLLLGQGRAPVQVAFRKASMLALERFSPPTKSTPYGYWQLLWFITPGDSDS